MRFSSRAFTAYATFFVLLGLVDQATARVGGGSPEDNDSPRDRQLLLELAEDNPIAGQYMVLFKPTPIVDLQATISTLVATLPGVSVLFTYEYTIQGVALGGITDPILSLLAGNGLVDMIVQVRADGVVLLGIRLRRTEQGRKHMNPTHSIILSSPLWNLMSTGQ